MQLYVAVYHATQEWPKREWYGLGAQLRGAANSAGSNLAEGSAKRGLREMQRYVNIAIGSLSEVAHQLMAARRVNLISERTFGELMTLQQMAARLTWRLLAGVRRRLQADAKAKVKPAS